MTTIFTHPANVQMLREEMEVSHPLKPVEVRSLMPYDPVLLSIAIVPCDYIPERDIQEEWKPPAPSRFIEYDRRDVAWMRQLGIGVTQVDAGPLFYEMRDTALQGVPKCPT